MACRPNTTGNRGGSAKAKPIKQNKIYLGERQNIKGRFCTLETMNEDQTGTDYLLIRKTQKTDWFVQTPSGECVVDVVHHIYKRLKGVWEKTVLSSVWNFTCQWSMTMFFF